MLIARLLYVFQRVAKCVAMCMCLETGLRYDAGGIATCVHLITNVAS